MTDKQIEQIAELRRTGLTYNKIASRMSLTQRQVRSFCLSRSPKREMEGEQEYCKTCGNNSKGHKIKPKTL